jgi:hypothetical protein
MRSWARAAACASVFAAIAASACAKSSQEKAVLQSDDLQSTEGATFDPNEIVELGSFTDTITIDVAQVQQFLERTPYNRASFLATYQSNGVRASDAIAKTSSRYGLNPLVFLVKSEMVQGLVGEEFYPSPPPRVEYVFACGCAGAGSCDPAVAGFDRQIDCLGRALRASLDEITANGQPSGRWGPGIPAVTLDGRSVTPADASTAAIYQYTPLVAFQKSGGSWLFWNLWQKYALALNYFGGTGSNAGAWIGDACQSDPSCVAPSAICVTNYPGGLCTASCTSACPSDTAHGPSFCADFPGQGGFCLAVCNPGAPACRSGYACTKVAKYGDKTQSQFVCLPK